jgi:hypothetical protein
MKPQLTIYVEDDDPAGSPLPDISDDDLCLVLPDDEANLPSVHVVTRSLYDELRHRRTSGLGMLVAKVSRAIRAVMGKRS